MLSKSMCRPIHRASCLISSASYTCQSTYLRSILNQGFATPSHSPTTTQTTTIVLYSNSDDILTILNTGALKSSIRHTRPSSQGMATTSTSTSFSFASGAIVAGVPDARAKIDARKEGPERCLPPADAAGEKLVVGALLRRSVGVNDAGRGGADKTGLIVLRLVEDAVGVVVVLFNARE
ncbi:hypothetical protein HGRIS_000496 [Hohenbuehelia grisea]|uniref:Uncharacterized protein n=1 Tax=Hohenbuehelia grisea TaxID=104357 RepID=A0ABR3JR69_9AGAR